MSWVTLGWIAVVALPVAVLVAAVLWPERLPSDRTVQAIRSRIEAEGDGPGHDSDHR